MPSIADMSIIEFRGLPIEGLRPGSRITIGNKEYEYYDSDGDDEIDDSPGPGRTLYKLIKRVSAPIEIFISYCSDLAGNGPDSVFERFISNGPRSRSSLRDKRKHFGLCYWAESPYWNLFWLDVHHYHRAVPLVDFVIDRRYAFSVRLTAAYYLTLVLALISPHDRHTILPIISLIYEALERIYEEGCRYISFKRHLHPLRDVFLHERDIRRLLASGREEVTQLIIGTDNRRIGCTEALIQLRQLNSWSITNVSDIETANRALIQLLPSLKQNPVDETQFESALRKGADTLYKYMVRSMRRRQAELKVQELIEELLYTVPCGPTYSIRCSSLFAWKYDFLDKFEMRWLDDDKTS